MLQVNAHRRIRAIAHDWPAAIAVNKCRSAQWRAIALSPAAPRNRRRAALFDIEQSAGLERRQRFAAVHRRAAALLSGIIKIGHRKYRRYMRRHKRGAPY